MIKTDFNVSSEAGADWHTKIFWEIVKKRHLNGNILRHRKEIVKGKWQ